MNYLIIIKKQKTIAMEKIEIEVRKSTNTITLKTFFPVIRTYVYGIHIMIIVITITIIT